MNYNELSMIGLKYSTLPIYEHIHDYVHEIQECNTLRFCK